jgi:hypothetical protein
VFARGREDYAIPAGTLTDPDNFWSINIGLFLMVTLSLLRLA